MQNGFFYVEAGNNNSCLSSCRNFVSYFCEYTSDVAYECITACYEQDFSDGFKAAEKALISLKLKGQCHSPQNQDLQRNFLVATGLSFLAWLANNVDPIEPDKAPLLIGAKSLISSLVQTWEENIGIEELTVTVSLFSLAHFWRAAQASSILGSHGTVSTIAARPTVNGGGIAALLLSVMPMPTCDKNTENFLCPIEL